MAVDEDRLIHAGGFAFQDAEEGDKASHELEAVEYIEDTMNWKDSDQVLKLYLQIYNHQSYLLILSLCRCLFYIFS